MEGNKIVPLESISCFSLKFLRNNNIYPKFGNQKLIQLFTIYHCRCNLTALFNVTIKFTRFLYFIENVAIMQNKINGFKNNLVWSSSWRSISQTNSSKISGICVDTRHLDFVSILIKTRFSS